MISMNPYLRLSGSFGLLAQLSQLGPSLVFFPPLFGFVELPRALSPHVYTPSAHRVTLWYWQVS